MLFIHATLWYVSAVFVLALGHLERKQQIENDHVVI